MGDATPHRIAGLVRSGITEANYIVFLVEHGRWVEAARELDGAIGHLVQARELLRQDLVTPTAEEAGPAPPSE